MRLYRSRCILLLSFFTAVRVFGQEPEENFHRGSRDSLLKNMPAIGRVFGSITDSTTKKPAEFASVALIRVRDSVPIAGTLADEKGNFSMSEVPFGRYQLKISSLGFGDYASTPFLLTPRETSRDMGRIFLQSKAKRLKQVEVTGEKGEYVNSLDRKVYNLDKNIVHAGGTATEVLRNIPSVTVDIDGNISLRGSGNVNVLIDGKPSGITGSTRQAVLQQIPASSIERIEVITNPSAKYDADGMAGIINIVTRKDKARGLNGNASVGVGTNEKYNAAAGGNLRTSKANYFANYSFRHEKRTYNSTSTRENFYGDSLFYNLSRSHGSGSNDAHVAKAGLDLSLTERTSVGISATASIRNDDRPDYNLFYDENAAHQLTGSFIRDNEEENENWSIDYNADFRKTFRKNKGEWTAGLSYSDNSRKEDEHFRTYTDVYVLTLDQDQTSERLNSVATAQTDYALPIGENAKLEAGWKSIFRNIDAQADGSNYFPSSNTSSPDPRFIDHFIYDEQVHAGYLMYTGRIKKFDYQAGLRGETYMNYGKSETTALDFDNNYRNLYPSGFLKYNLAKSQEVQVSYSKRVNRPESRTMNPFIDYSDTLNLRMGNPALKPEYIDSYELSYQKTFDKHSIQVTFYYRYTNNLITRYRFLDQSTNVTTSTFTNFSSSENSGAEIILKNQLGQTINLMTSGNIYQNKVNGSNVESELQGTSTNWNARTSINAKLAKNTSLQISAMYMAPIVSPQGSFRGMSGVDAGVRQDLWKGRASLNLNVNDIFNTRKFVVRNNGQGFTSEYTRMRESRTAMLNFSVHFGKAEYNPKKKNQRNQNQPSDQNNLMDDF